MHSKNKCAGAPADWSTKFEHVYTLIGEIVCSCWTNIFASTPNTPGTQRCRAFLHSHKLHVLVRGLLILALAPFPSAQALNQKLEDAKQHYLRSHKLSEQGNVEQALDDAKQSVILDPTVSEYHYWKAHLLYNCEEDDQTALSEINRACSMSPGNSGYWNQKASILRRLNRLPEALEAVDVSVKLKTSKISLLTKADILAAMGQLQNAEDCLTAAIEKFGSSNPNLRDERELRARIAAQLRHWSLVILDTTAIIHTHPRGGGKFFSDVDAHLLRAQALTETKQIALARAEYLATLALWPDMRQVHEAALKFFKTTGDHQNAIKEAQKLKEFDSDFKPF